jgi:hypothetical protein
MAIAVDLDGTLAHYEHWEGEHQIGNPIEPMKKFVLKQIAKGEEVVIFTARADSESAIIWVRLWLKKHGFPNLEITNIKLKKFKKFYDDRAVHVTKNKGIIHE